MYHSKNITTIPIRILLCGSLGDVFFKLAIEKRN